MSIDRTRYRQLDFIGARILQARELNWIQEMDQGVAVSDNETPVSGQLQAMFRQGALYNITVGVAGLVVTLSATDGAKPMMIFVRDRWEIFPSNNDDTTDGSGTYPGNHTMTLSNIETIVYLNWELKIRTGGLIGDDVSLTDATTNEAVASAGELILHLSNTDTSGASLSGSQLAKNVAPIPLLTFTNSGAALTFVPTDNALAQALANSKVAGLAKGTTDTAAGVVVSTDDPRMTNGRPAADGSVHDSSVRTPVAAGGTNSDATPTYNLTGDIGGISAAKIIYVAGTQLLSDFATWIKTQFLNLQTAFNNHATTVLGQPNTHPIPTAAQVGAAPLSHVGQALGLVTSHPPVVNQDSQGFRVNRSGGGGSVDDPAYGVFVSGAPIVAMNHDGDVKSTKSGAFTAAPGGSLAAGALSHLSLIAQVLSQHVNQTSHANPHGLVPGDIGAASVGYVDSSVAGVLAAAESYTDTATLISKRTSTHRTGSSHAADPAATLQAIPQTQTFMDYDIFRFGQHFELAIGTGACFDQDTLLLPEASGWTSSQAHVQVSMQWLRMHYDSDTTAVITANYNSGTNKIGCRENAAGHTPNFLNSWANVFAVFYRFI